MMLHMWLASFIEAILKVWGGRAGSFGICTTVRDCFKMASLDKRTTDFTKASSPSKKMSWRDSSGFWGGE